MDRTEPGKRVEILLNESDRWRNRPLSTAILEMLRREGAAGATASRGFAGFAGHRRMESLTTDRLLQETPVCITWIDRAPLVDRLMPKLHEMLQGGAIS